MASCAIVKARREGGPGAGRHAGHVRRVGGRSQAPQTMAGVAAGACAGSSTGARRHQADRGGDGPSRLGEATPWTRGRRGRYRRPDRQAPPGPRSVSRGTWRRDSRSRWSRASDRCGERSVRQARCRSGSTYDDDAEALRAAPGGRRRKSQGRRDCHPGDHRRFDASIRTTKPAARAGRRRVGPRHSGEAMVWQRSVARRRSSSPRRRLTRRVTPWRSEALRRRP